MESTLDLKEVSFDCGMIDPTTVSWSRVLVVYKLLSAFSSLYRSPGDDADEEPSGGATHAQYLRWLCQSLERDETEFNIALMMLFDVVTDPRLNELMGRLSPDDEERACRQQTAIT